DRVVLDINLDMVVRAAIETGKHVDAVPAIVGHRVVLDVDLEGVLVCPTRAPKDVNAREGVTGDGVMSESRAGDDVVIAQGEHKDPECSIPHDLVVGDGSIGDLRIRTGSRQAGQDEGAVAGVLHHHVMGESGVGNQGARHVAGSHVDAINL